MADETVRRNPVTNGSDYTLMLRLPNSLESTADQNIAGLIETIGNRKYLNLAKAEKFLNSRTNEEIVIGRKSSPQKADIAYDFPDWISRNQFAVGYQMMGGTWYFEDKNPDLAHPIAVKEYAGQDKKTQKSIWNPVQMSHAGEPVDLKPGRGILVAGLDFLCQRMHNATRKLYLR